MSLLASALVVSQKTQVFFHITVQNAVLIALHNDAYFNATSWAQLWINTRAMCAIGHIGVDPVVFGMFLLRKANRLSWYVAVASTCCVLMSSICIFKANAVNVTPGKITQHMPR